VKNKKHHCLEQHPNFRLLYCYSQENGFYFFWVFIFSPTPLYFVHFRLKKNAEDNVSEINSVVTKGKKALCTKQEKKAFFKLSVKIIRTWKFQGFA
jgi:hypothetical protein